MLIEAWKFFFYYFYKSPHFVCQILVSRKKTFYHCPSNRMIKNYSIQDNIFYCSIFCLHQNEPSWIFAYSLFFVVNIILAFIDLFISKTLSFYHICNLLYLRMKLSHGSMLFLYHDILFLLNTHNLRNQEITKGQANFIDYFPLPLQLHKDI